MLHGGSSRSRHRLLAALSAVLVLAGAITLGLAARTTARQQTAGQVIDLTGRQRMLNERYLKEILMTLRGIEADYEGTRELFEQTGRALADGGPALVEDATGRVADLPPAPTPEIRARLIADTESMRRQAEVAAARLAATDEAQAAARLEELLSLNALLAARLDATMKEVETHYAGRLAVVQRWEIASQVVLILTGLGLVAQLLRAGTLNRRLRDEESRRQRAGLELAAVVESVVEGIIVIDVEGTIRSFNPAAERLFGYREEEVVGRNVGLLMPEPHRSSHGGYIRRYLETGEPRIIGTGREDTARRKDGTLFPIYLAISEMRSADETLFVGTMRDLTEEKRVQEALRASEERFALAVRGSSDGLWDWDVITDEVWYAPRFKQMLGYEDAEFPNVFASFESHLHEDDHDRTLQAVARHLEDRKPYDVEYRLRTRGGGYRWFRARGQALWDDSGRPLRMAGSIIDITRRKRAEEELLLAKEAAEEANAAKSRFLANMSHELRTPLNAIIGYSELLEEDAAEAGRAGETSDLRKIQQAGRQLLGLINDVLDLSKVEAGKLPIHRESVELSELVAECRSTVRPLFEKSGNRLELRCDARTPRILADPTRLRQVVLNLLSNADKFTAGGTVVVETGPDPEDGSRARLRVIDSGIGMTREQIDRIFEPFAQADDTTTRRYGGTGLGLAICRRLCEAMGGRITVASRRGEGSTFTVTLPVAPPVEAAQEIPGTGRVAPAPAEAVTGAPDAPTVVVIDDDPQVRELLVRYLTHDGYRVLPAGDGAEGIELARRAQPVAITLDVMMPSMDGWTALTALKRDPDLADIPVIVLTMIENRELGFALGASDYLIKPIDRRRLVQALRTHCSSGRRADVLVVDDDPDVREMVRRTLSGEGCVIHEAENGRRALELLGSVAPDVVLLDLLMPEMDGFEVVDAMRRSEKWRAIPVLVLTGKDLTPAERDRLHGSVTRILRKGACGPAELARAVRSQLRVAVRQPEAARSSPTEEEASDVPAAG